MTTVEIKKQCVGIRGSNHPSENYLVMIANRNDNKNCHDNSRD